MYIAILSLIKATIESLVCLFLKILIKRIFKRKIPKPLYFKDFSLFLPFQINFQLANEISEQSNS